MSKTSKESGNSVCCINPTHKPNPNMPVAVYPNCSCDAINCTMFEEFCGTRNRKTDLNGIFGGVILVFMDNLYIHDATKGVAPVLSNKVKNYFYRSCGEDSCKTNDMTLARVSPVLKLYPGCPMMLTGNKDFHNGQANGSRVWLKKVKVIPGEQPTTVQLLPGTKIYGFFASQISSLSVKHEVGNFVPDTFDVLVTAIVPDTFDVLVMAVSFQAKVYMDDEMHTVILSL
jgi:hypothetical protein